MTETTRPNFLGAMRRATDSALLAMDRLARELDFPPGSSGAATLEAQREIILAVATMSELVAEVRDGQDEFFTSPRFKSLFEDGIRDGITKLFGDLARGMGRRRIIYGLVLGAMVVALGAVVERAGFNRGRGYEFSTLVADCVRQGVPLAPGSERFCGLVMTPDASNKPPEGLGSEPGKGAPPVFPPASPADNAPPVLPR